MKWGDSGFCYIPFRYVEKFGDDLWTSKKMKGDNNMRRVFVVLLVLCFAASFAVPAQADIFGKRERKLEARAGAGISIEPNTILSGLTQVVDYLGTREGLFMILTKKKYATTREQHYILMIHGTHLLA